MQSKSATFFKTSFFIGLALTAIATGAIVYEYITYERPGVQSLYGTLAIGLLFIYFSGRPMLDERIQFLKFKSLAIAFFIGLILVNLLNYLITYPDGNQTNSISSYLFALICLVLSFIIFFILQKRE